VSLDSFVIAILCKAWDLLRLRFIGVPKIDQFRQEFLDCYRRGISPRLRAEGTWTSTEVEITNLPINSTFAAEADIELIEPMANYFPPACPGPSNLPHWRLGLWLQYILWIWRGWKVVSNMSSSPTTSGPLTRARAKEAVNYVIGMVFEFTPVARDAPNS
jgi:hypothetical protein